MRIRSASGKTVFEDVELADTPLKRTKGIMLKSQIRKPMLFIFRREARFENSIHSFFCFVPFDAIFLDEKRKIVDIIPNVKPFSLSVVPKKPSKYLIECKGGSAKKLKLKEGQALRF